jgi:CheY-like chemotaxis protein
MAECTEGKGDSAKRSARYLLIVDDVASERIYTSMLIQRFGYNSCTTASGKEALEMATTVVPALIITDHDLPDMKGMDLVRKLRGSAWTAYVPVIVKAAVIAETDIQQYRKAGVAAILDHTGSTESLFRAVQTTLEATPRGTIRVRTRLPVVVDGRQLECGEGECVSELSEYGMYIRTLHPCPLHKKVAARVTIHERTIEVEAEVLYCHHFGEGPYRQPGMGLKFIAAAPGDRDYLKAYIDEEITKGMPDRGER